MTLRTFIVSLLVSVLGSLLASLFLLWLDL